MSFFRDDEQQLLAMIPFPRQVGLTRKVCWRPLPVSIRGELIYISSLKFCSIAPYSAVIPRPSVMRLGLIPGFESLSITLLAKIYYGTELRNINWEGTVDVWIK